MLWISCDLLGMTQRGDICGISLQQTLCARKCIRCGTCHPSGIPYIYLLVLHPRRVTNTRAYATRQLWHCPGCAFATSVTGVTRSVSIETLIPEIEKTPLAKSKVLLKICKKMLRQTCQFPFSCFLYCSWFYQKFFRPPPPPQNGRGMFADAKARKLCSSNKWYHKVLERQIMFSCKLVLSDRNKFANCKT